AVHHPVQAMDLARAADRDQLHLARVAWLEAHGGAGRDVEAHAVRRRAIEDEMAVDLEEMKMRSHLHVPIAVVADLDPPRRATSVQLDRIRREKIFAWFHVSLFCTGGGAPPPPRPVADAARQTARPGRRPSSKGL